jgi:hypothetical protein
MITPFTLKDGRDWFPKLHQPAKTFGCKRVRIMGLDLGQSIDHSAAAVNEYRVADDGFIGPRDPYIRLISLRRWRKGADYNEVVEEVLHYPGLDVLCVEFNGVGRPVVDMLRRRARELEVNIRIIPCITAASRARMHAVQEERGTCYSIPKVDIVSAINILAQSRRLILLDSPDLPNLFDELRKFQMRITQAANLQFGNMSGKDNHDDIVIAWGLACWWLIKAPRREPAIFIP